ncbi:hypothetical protein GQ42DRAFT_165354 [Ramicandelaber brevisporus]|nr:hypothetical protein GQ42DRAFT_165354 [Ramicandelaber brevisporus]
MMKLTPTIALFRSTSSLLWRHQTRTFSTIGGRSFYAPATLPVPVELSEGERKLFSKLNERLEPIMLEVADISGGCGSMYAVSVQSKQFDSVALLQQHMMVKNILKEDIAGMHGIQLKTFKSTQNVGNDD